VRGINLAHERRVMRSELNRNTAVAVAVALLASPSRVLLFLFYPTTWRRWYNGVCSSATAIREQNPRGSSPVRHGLGRRHRNKLCSRRSARPARQDADLQPLEANQRRGRAGSPVPGAVLRPGRRTGRRATVHFRGGVRRPSEGEAERAHLPRKFFLGEQKDKTLFRL